MRSFTKKYFYPVGDYSDLHKVKYNDITCYFNGWGFYDKEQNLLFNYYPNEYFSTSTKFKLMSVKTLKSGRKNYLGCNTKTGTLMTFDEEQITFKKINNEESI